MRSKIIALLLLLLCMLNVNAQDDNVRTKSVYVEVLGPSNGIGVTLAGDIVSDLVSDIKELRISSAKRLYEAILCQSA